MPKDTAISRIFKHEHALYGIDADGIVAFGL